jgi:hypothetical protein
MTIPAPEPAGHIDVPDPAKLHAVTIWQPEAWTTAHGGRTIHNSSRHTGYQGELCIHAGKHWHNDARHDGRIIAAWRKHSRQGQFTGNPTEALCEGAGQIVMGAIIAVATLTDCHPALVGRPCCAPWGDPPVAYHLVLENIRALPEPVPCRGLPSTPWKPPAAVAAQVVEQLRALPGQP